MLKILEKTIKQSEALKSGDIDKLNEITDQKQSLIFESEKIDKEFKVIYEQVSKDGLAGLSDVKKRIDNIEKLVEKIYKMSKENINALKKQMDDVRQSIKHANVGRKGLKAYFVKEMGGSYIDQKN